MNAQRNSSFELREYQAVAARSCLAALRTGEAPLLVAPTGSGKTVIAAEVAKHFRRPLVIAHRRELVEQAQRVFGRHVRARTIQSVIREGPGSLLRRPDALFIDEAHRADATTYRQIIDWFSRVPRLGMTATPRRTDGRGLCDAFSIMIQASSVSELMDAGHLVRYRAFEARDEHLRQLAWMKRECGDYAQKNFLN